MKKSLFGDRIGGSAIESRIRASLKRGDGEFTVPKSWVEANTFYKPDAKAGRIARIAKHYGYDLTLHEKDYEFKLGAPVVFVEPSLDLEGPIEGEGALPDD